jgi:hypothetical protein
MKIFDRSVHPDEQRTPITFDFTDVLGTDTISGTPTITVDIWNDGVDASPSTHLDGAPLVLTGNQKVEQFWTGGVAGVDYRIRCLVKPASDANRRIAEVVVLPVRLNV